IIAIEDRADLLRAALTLYDWRKHFESTRFVLLFGPDAWKVLSKFLDRYAFSALERASVIPGSGPAESNCALAENIAATVKRAADTQRQLAVSLIKEELSHGLSQKRSHVRKVLWLVPGHNYLQKCCVASLNELGIKADHHLWISAVYRYIKRYEWIRLLQEYEPDALVLVNATPVTFFGGVEIDRLSVRVASWFVDNPQRFVREPVDLAGVDLIASFDKFYLPYLKGLGANNLIEIRTAAGLFRRIDSGQSADGPAVSFVGELGTRGFWDLQTLVSRSMPDLHKAIQVALDKYAKDPSQSLEDLYNRHADTARFPFRGSTVELVENQAAYIRRKQTLEAVSDLGLVTFGDTDWGNPQRAGALADCWAGRRVDYFDELPAVYAGSQINVNIFHPQCRLAPNPRVYDVLACGGFLLTTDNPGLADEFTDGEHLVVFRTADELRELIRYYLEHPDKRRRIALAGQQRILAACRYHDRMRRFFSAFDQIHMGDSYVYSC
ncbi:MAG: glycosyltransferase, partial [bacterium]